MYANSNSGSVDKNHECSVEIFVRTPSPRDQFHRPQNRDSPWSEGLHVVGNAGLTAHHNKASEGLAEFPLSPLHALGCDPGPKTVPDDQNIPRFRALTNQPFDGRECVAYGATLGWVSGTLGEPPIIDCENVDLHA